MEEQRGEEEAASPAASSRSSSAPTVRFGHDSHQSTGQSGFFRALSSQQSFMNSANLGRRSLAELLQMEYQPPPKSTRAKKNEWDWLPKRTSKVVPKMLPAQVTEVKRDEQRCAFSFFAILVGVFLCFSAIMITRRVQMRTTPAQSVALKTNLPVLDRFPNIVVCYPPWAGSAEWLPLGHMLHGWKQATNQSTASNISSALQQSDLPYVILEQSNCPLIKQADKGRCMFIKTAWLKPEPHVPVVARGVQLFLTYIRQPLQPTDLGINYRGGYISMASQDPQQWCHLDRVDADLIQWQEAPFDDFRPGNSTYLPFLALSVSYSTIIKLKRSYTPVEDLDRERTEYTVVPRLSSYHLGSDTALLPSAALERIEPVHKANHQGNFTEIAGVGRFIVTQELGVMTYEELEPIQLLDLFGTLSGVWSGLMAIFTCLFVSTSGGKRRLPKVLKRGMNKVMLAPNLLFWLSRARRSKSGSGSLNDVESGTSSNPGSGNDLVRPEEVDEEEKEPIEYRVDEIEKVLTELLQKQWVPAQAHEGAALRSELSQLRAYVQRLEREVQSSKDERNRPPKSNGGDDGKGQ